MVNTAGHSPVAPRPICPSWDQLSSATSHSVGDVPAHAHGAPGESKGVTCKHLQTSREELTGGWLIISFLNLNWLGPCLKSGSILSGRGASLEEEQESGSDT